MRRFSLNNAAALFFVHDVDAVPFDRRIVGEGFAGGPLLFVHDVDAVPFERRVLGERFAAIAHRSRGEIVGA